MRVIEKMNILEIAKSITKEDIEKADGFLSWCRNRDDNYHEVCRIINKLGFKSQSQVDVVFFMKWLELNHD